MGSRRDALHPVILAAGEDGELPDWAVMSETRRAHADRVARLMRKWAKTRGLRKADRIRWRAAGLLHDGLKGVDPDRLRDAFKLGREWPDPILHGPACAKRLRQDGVTDRPLLRAIAHHTTGHPKLDLLGESLYVADYLDPGRRSRRDRRRALRARMPEEHMDVLADVVAAKIATLLERRLQIPDVTVQFWAGMTDER